ncbi:hypothetical protein BVX97_05650 [bacterium E08(2017)]|nr:hypothetical protein BVX97_05650 [bacterium E08(2017)]
MKKFFVIMVLAGCMCGSSNAAKFSWSEFSTPTLTILDNPIYPSYTVDLGYIEESTVDGGDATGMLEFEAKWRDVLYFRDVLSGDLAVGFDLDMLIFTDSADIDLPGQAVALAADIGWTWRYVSGDAFGISLSPGLYSDIEEIAGRAFFVPFSGVYYKAFHSDIAGVLGLQVRPRFERVFFPVVGIDWIMHDNVRLMLMLPESRLTIYIDNRWSIHGGYEWRSLSYATREAGNYDRTLLTYEDSKYSVGLTYKMSDELQITGEGGTCFSRMLEFDKPGGGIPAELDVEKASFVRVGIGGPF